MVLRHYVRCTCVLALAILLSGCLIDLGGTNGRNSLWCCCLIEDDGIESWPRDGYSCSRRWSCESSVQQFLPSKELCPYQSNETSMLDTNPFGTGNVASWFESQHLLVQLAEPATVLDAPLSTTLQTEYSGECRVHCADDNSPFCLTISGQSTPVIAGQMARFRDLFTNGDNIVAKTDILASFDLTNDPCNRSDTSVKNGKLTNDGDLCRFDTSLALGVGAAKLLSIELPKNLDGRYHSALGVGAKFSTQEHAAKLVIEGGLNETYGGYITAVEYSQGNFFIGTENGCIALID